MSLASDLTARLALAIVFEFFKLDHGRVRFLGLLDQPTVVPVALDELRLVVYFVIV